MNEEMKKAWAEITEMLGEPTREELDVFLRTWQRATEAHRKALAEQPAQQQEPDELRHIGEQDCLLDVDEKAWSSLVENRGGCRCHISPPCGACSNPISEEEMNEVGYTYAAPQPAQQEPVAKDNSNYRLDPPGLDPLYTSPPAQRTWVGLTDETLDDVYFCVEGSATPLETWREQARTIEAKLKEKNT